MPRFVLASASPRRADLLRAAGFDFEVRPAHVDESPRDGEPPREYVRRLSRDKASAVAALASGRPVLAADTVVVLDHHMLGKPKDDQDARRMLALLSGRRHEVMTGVTLKRGQEAGGKKQGAGSGEVEALSTVEVTSVTFAPLTPEEIDWYVASGEPADKAGAYAIQGLASRFVARIDGSYSNVVGLPVEVVYAMLRELGFTGNRSETACCRD